MTAAAAEHGWRRREGRQPTSLCAERQRNAARPAEGGRKPGF